MYGIERHWYTWGPMVPYYHATQPWVVGFNGEVTLGGMNYGGIVWARLWIDRELKKEMGYYINCELWDGGTSLPSHNQCNSKVVSSCVIPDLIRDPVYVTP